MLGMLLTVAGCLVIDKPELALDIPESYKWTRGAPKRRRLRSIGGAAFVPRN